MKNHLYTVDTLNIDFSVTAHLSLPYQAVDTCPVCNQSSVNVTSCPTDIHIVNSQKKWPDKISSMRGTCLVSDRVIASLHEHNITCFSSHPVFLKNVPQKKIPLHSYRLLSPFTTVSMAILENEYTRPFICPICHRFDANSFYSKQTNLLFPPIYDIQDSEYQGEDIVFAREGGRERLILCTDKIIELCRQDKWTNFRFVYRSPFGGCFQIHHNSPNWRELLEQDIAQKRAELRGEIPPPIHVSVPETPPQEEAPKPVSDHPFDHLSAFDGFAWQGTTHLPCAFGVCDFIVYEDEEASDDESDEPLPTLGQRHLFDFFVASQEKILPPLQEALLRALQTCNVSVSEVESFSDLSQFLESGDLEIHKASSKGRGDLSILFSIKDHSKTISIKWSCTPSRDSIRLKSIHFVD